VDYVDFYIDGSLEGTDTDYLNPPFEYSWVTDSGSYPDGPYVLSAVAYDMAGNSAVSTSDPTVTVDNTAPTVTIGAPSVSAANGSATVTYTLTYSESVTSSLDAGDITVTNGGTASSAVLSITNVTATTADVNINVGTGDGAVTITVAAGTGTDAAGNVEASGAGPSAAFTEDNTIPAVNISSPLDGATVSGTVIITATATDTGGSGINHVEFFINASSVGTDSSDPYEYSWVTSTGSYDLRADAYDNAGNSALDDDTNVTVP